MRLEDLKRLVTEKLDIDFPIIFVYSDTDFIPHQYTREIAHYLNLDIVLAEKLSDIVGGFNVDSENTLYVHKTDELNTKITSNKKVVVFCKNASEYKSNDSCVVEIPKLTKEIIMDYIASRCPTVYDRLRDLPDLCNNNMYAIDNELSKISIFSPSINELTTATADKKCIPGYVLDKFLSDGSLSYLANESVMFDLIKAVLTKNKKWVDFLLALDIEYNAALFYQLTFSQICDVIRVVVDASATPEKLGITKGKFWAIKYTYAGIWNKNGLSNVLYFISDIDEKIKSGSLKFNKELIYYIAINILRS